MSTPKYRFFLGGRDLEMVAVAETVRALLGDDAVCDKGLRWGARASDYQGEIDDAAAAGVRPVLVELTLDRDPPAGGWIVVDHHGAAAGIDAPTSLERVFALLNPPAGAWTRRHALIAANDRGHVRALRAMGASPDEIAAVRAADRRAQGVTPSEEEEGRRAAASARVALDGRALVVDSPHDRVAAITDPLEEAGRAPEILFVLTPGEVAVFGPGSVIAALDAAFPGGWRGGELPTRGFWGCPRDAASTEAALLAVAASAAFDA